MLLNMEINKNFHQKYLKFLGMVLTKFHEKRELKHKLIKIKIEK